MIRKITIPKDLFERMVNHSKEEEPIEACGFLIGDKVDDEAVASHILPADNILSSPVLFEISPEEIYKAWITAEKMGKDVVGVYHSHPHGGLTPSPRDVQFMRHSDFVWLILKGKRIRGFIWDNGVTEILVEILEWS